MVKKMYVPNRGDVVWLDFDPQAGHEQKGRRPAFVLSSESYNRIVGLGLFCPITNQEKGYPFEVSIPADYAISGVILSDHIKSLDWRARKATFICHLPEEITKEVLDKILTLFQ